MAVELKDVPVLVDMFAVWVWRGLAGGGRRGFPLV